MEHMEPLGMGVDEYRVRGKEMVDYIAEYLTTLRQRHVLPNVQPGYLRELVPDQAPLEGEDWENIFHDIERVIMPGITHWQSPHMHAYFPALNSFPSLLGDMLSDAINCLGFTWASSPACTELEMVVTDWLGKMLDLPSFFLHRSKSKGGGVLQGTMSEATLVAMLAARMAAIGREREKCTDPESDMDSITICSRLVAYCSDQAHSSVEKNCMIAMMRLRKLPSDDNLSLRGDTLREAFKQDREKGLIPFYVCVTLGTTGACSFDNLAEIGDVCKEEENENIWVHVDAAYAGTGFLCPEFRHYLKGIEHCHSFAFNPSKWLMVNFDCTAMWVKDKKSLETAFCVNPLYLKHEKQGAAIDYMHWQIPLSRRFRALKLWFVIRSYGIKGLQQHIRKGVELATFFEELVRKDPAFEVPAERVMGLIVFRLRGQNSVTEELLSRLNGSGKLYMVPAAIKSLYVIRFTITSLHTTKEDLRQDWDLIRKIAKEVLRCPNRMIRPTRLASWPTGAMDSRIDAYLAEEVGLKIDEKAREHDKRFGSFMAKAGRIFPLRKDLRRKSNQCATCQCHQNAQEKKKGVLRRAQSEDVKSITKGVFFCSGCHRKLEAVRITKIASPVSIKGYEHSPEAALSDVDDDVFAVSEEDEDEAADIPEDKVGYPLNNNGDEDEEKINNGLSEKMSKLVANGFAGQQDGAATGENLAPASMGRFGALSQTKESKYNGVVNITHFHAATSAEGNKESDATTDGAN
ncbi:aromatic-L-amino-acid decarboxylase-like [Amphiura filiformis]|uniref:aromatic-L-amino-acid decarboxylase-like n=1 Tax=Amphiura filiformis TaxID=82378 RepID=UPI003B2135C7